MDAFVHRVHHSLHEDSPLLLFQVHRLKKARFDVVPLAFDVVLDEFVDLSPFQIHSSLVVPHLVEVEVLVGEELVDPRFQELSVFEFDVLLLKSFDQETFVGRDVPGPSKILLITNWLRGDLLNLLLVSFALSEFWLCFLGVGDFADIVEEHAESWVLARVAFLVEACQRQ